MSTTTTTIDAETIARYRRKYAELVAMMDRPGPWDRAKMLAAVGSAFDAAKTIPSLLDEIERLQAAPTPAGPGATARDDDWE